MTLLVTVGLDAGVLPIERSSLSSVCPYYFSGMVRHCGLEISSDLISYRGLRALLVSAGFI